MSPRGSSWSGVMALACCAGVLCLIGARLADTNGMSPQEVCFANLSRLAQATLMYVEDSGGMFPPHQSPMEPYECQWGADNSNPWLRWPVILDDYVGDRSVYSCPGVPPRQEQHGVMIHPHWITSERISGKGWPQGPCGSVWPPGWGGSVTDSAVQGASEGPGGFGTAIGGAINVLGGKRLSEIGSASRHVMWADSSRTWVKLGSVVWANACRADCAELDGKADWEGCPWSQQCGAGGDFTTNPEVRERLTRHEGGSNIAFVDGHVKWLSVAEMLAAYEAGNLLGIEPHANTKGEPWYLE